MKRDVGVLAEGLSSLTFAVKQGGFSNADALKESRQFPVYRMSVKASSACTLSFL